MESMKKIGIIGGVTWVSTHLYYKLINQKINERLGGHHSAEIIINSVDFAEVIQYLQKDEWDNIEDLILERAQELKRSGADFIAISSNTMAKIGQNVSKKASIHLIDIFQSTAVEVKNLGLKKVALLGTVFTMKDPFFINELERQGVSSVVPNLEEIDAINEIIMTELTKGIIVEKSKNVFINIINRMEKDEGIDGVILGCTEIPLLIKKNDVNLPIFDTTEIHTNYIVNYALQ